MGPPRSRASRRDEREAEPAAGRRSGRDLLLGALLFLATLAAYWRVYGVGYARPDGRTADAPGFIWDDQDYVFQNPHLPDPHGLERIWFHREESPQYYPLVYTTFWLEYRLWGGPDASGRLQAWGYHLTNVVLHAISALLVWRILRRVGFGAAFAAAAVFALHPMCVESVAWVTERKNVLSLVFYLLAVLALLRWEEEPGGRRWAWWGLGFLLFFLGLFSKTVIASLPVALLILRWWRRKPITPAYLLGLLPLLLAGFGMGRLTAEHEQEYVLRGDLGPYWDLSFGERILIAGRALWFYVGKVLWPHPLVFNYPRWTISTRDLVAWIWPIAAVAAGFLLLGLARRGRRGPLAAAAFYAATIFPALGFVNVAPMRFSYVADHFAYAAILGLIAGVVGLAAELLDAERFRGWRMPALALVVVVLGVLTRNQTELYRDVEYLWRDTLVHYPESHLARINLGVLLRQRGETDEARAHFQRVLEDWPDWPWTRARALTNLGSLDQQVGKIDEAVEKFREAAAATPAALEPRFNLANALVLQGHPDEAIPIYRTLLEETPAHIKARYNLGCALEQTAKVAEAEAEFRRVVEQDARFAMGWTGLGRVAIAKGTPAEAVDDFRKAREIDPAAPGAVLGEVEALLRAGRRDQGLARADAVASMAVAGSGLRREVALRLRDCGEHAAAIRMIRAGVAADPRDGRLQILLVEELSAAPDPELRSGEEALRIAQGLVRAGLDQDPPTLAALACAYAETGRFEDARASLRQSLAAARARGMSQLVPTLEERMKTFEAGKPLRLP
jgi:tetratricopeptide (TPR) repeat protein